MVCVGVIGALLMQAWRIITVCNKNIGLSMKSNPITRFIPQKLFLIVWYSDPSGFGLLKCTSLVAVEVEKLTFNKTSV